MSSPDAFITSGLGELAKREIFEDAIPLFKTIRSVTVGDPRDVELVFMLGCVSVTHKHKEIARIRLDGEDAYALSQFADGLFAALHQSLNRYVRRREFQRRVLHD